MDTATNKIKPSFKTRNSIYFKIGFILFLTILLMVPASLVEDLIHERSRYQNQVRNEIAQSWGAEQVFSGPLLAIPYKVEHISAELKKYKTSHTFYLTPSNLDINVDLDSEIRKKSIYESILYTSSIQAHGEFDLSTITELGDVIVDYDNATFLVGISNPISINKKVDLLWNNDSIELSPGINGAKVIKNGIHSKVSIKDITSIDFNLSLDLRGNHYMYFEPTAKNTTISMTSDWASPGFVGSILAEQREITSKGFQASWSISEFNRNVPDYWTDQENYLSSPNGTFGVDLINPVNHYQKNMRSAKYALLIISLTFLVFFFFEILYKKKVHPIQYSLIGLALILFYYLLLSFTEHIGFTLSYIIASLSTILLISGYSLSLLKSKKTTLLLFSILSLLYSYIFILLQLEEFALVAGSIGLFVILSAVMYLSRNLDWYNLMNNQSCDKKLV